MSIPNIKKGLNEDREYITNYDLTAAAHELLGGIELDVASSKVANEYVQAENYFTPSEDGLNIKDWYGRVYLFPPSGAYFWNKKEERWKMTRASSPSLTSSHAVWFRKLYKSWWNNDIEQGLYFTNCPDMIRYEQKIFDFPVCILRTAPTLIKNTSQGITTQRTCTSLLVYLQPKGDPTFFTERFIEIYSPKGRIIV
jgi:hypothetical protein